MIILDTNVISEALRASPEPRVIEWIDGQPAETLFLSSITVAELRAGVALLPAGKHRTAFDERIEKRVLPLFWQRILAFDLECTHAYATLIAKTRRAGLAIATADACIAAIAVTHGFAVATRDRRPFTAAGLTVIDPWTTERDPS